MLFCNIPILFNCSVILFEKLEAFNHVKSLTQPLQSPLVKRGKVINPLADCCCAYYICMTCLWKKKKHNASLEYWAVQCSIDTNLHCKLLPSAKSRSFEETSAMRPFQGSMEFLNCRNLRSSSCLKIFNTAATSLSSKLWEVFLQLVSNPDFHVIW